MSTAILSLNVPQNHIRAILRVMEVFIIAAISVDGFISPLDQTSLPSTSWTSPEDKTWFNQKTLEAGVTVMGRSTWDTIPTRHKPLKNRLNIIYTNHPENISGSKPLVESSAQDKLDPRISYTTNLSPEELVSLVETRGYTSLAICGGCHIYTHFLEADVVNALYLTIEPIVFGRGIPLFDNELVTKLKLVATKPLNPTTLLNTYQVTKS